MRNLEPRSGGSHKPNTRTYIQHTAGSGVDESFLTAHCSAFTQRRHVLKVATSTTASRANDPEKIRG